MIPVVPPKSDKKSKEELNEQANKYKTALENQIENIKEKGFNIGKTALIVGGIAFAGYILFDLFSGNNKSKANKKAVFKVDSNNLLAKKETKDSWIVSSIKGYILAFLIGIAREKIAEALAELKKDDKTTDL
jgi:hypothetical protein